MSNELMKLIEDYAEWSAQSYWEDDQGYPASAEVARANKEAARKAVVDAVAALQAENERLAHANNALVPLTQKQVVEGFCNTAHQAQYVAVFDAGVRFAEATHGIRAAKGGQQ